MQDHTSDIVFFMFLYTWPRTSKVMTRLLHTFMPCTVLCFLRQHVFVF